LQKRNAEHFLPTIKRLTQRKDRKKEVRFRCLRDTALKDCLGTIGSPCFNFRVSFDWWMHGRPVPIPDYEINSLRTLAETHRSKLAGHPNLEEGMLVEVTNGPLRGVKGRLIREARYARLVLSVSLIRRSVAVEIDVDSVVPGQCDKGLCKVC
jgi:hypothetical protein